MKILIDTNVLISAALNNKGTPYQAFIKAVTVPNQAVVTDQNIDEFRRIFNRKFPSKIAVMEMFLSLFVPTVEVIKTSCIDIPEEEKIRDVKDRPILRAAIENNVDIILTGDKDFIESGLALPKSVTPADFLNM